MNVTDVDDKLLRRASELSCEPRVLAREMESSFLADLRALNVRPPIRLTRVTEFVPEIVALIERILAAGFAYESNGSVYFDVRARLRDSTHPRLMPSRIVRFADAVPPSQHDDEGAAPSDKRFWADFALWKAVPAAAGIDGAKQLVWLSPFGPGRPGWHIECSAMARAAFGDELDVHAGGIDLRFPHHENEILQCDAALNDGKQPDRQWPNYFLHVGHVQIAGQKMSKSLKNFQSIRSFLDTHSADAFRWFCLMHRYDDAVEYHEQAMQDARRQADRVREFLDMLERHLAAPIAAGAVWNEHETNLQRRVFASRVAIDAHLRNNFDTAATLHELNRLITAVSSYVGAHPDRVPAARGVLANTAGFVMTLMDEFGLRAHRQQQQLAASDGAAGRAAAVADAACGIRDRVRALARSIDHKASSAALWQLADEIRDELLPKAGVDVRDEADGKKSNWRWQSKEKE
jgi:cysteinyl-tRNA synthetase